MNVLSNDQIIQIAPAAATNSHTRSAKYTQCSTMSVVDKLRAMGLKPHSAMQSYTRYKENVPYAKHLIRFALENHGDIASEVLLFNSHDGQSSLRIMNGIYRFVCSNGLIIGDTQSDYRIRHIGSNSNTLEESVENIVSQSRRAVQMKKQMQETMLNQDEIAEFAGKALESRYGSEHKYLCSSLTKVRRAEDLDNSVWTTFNVVQENVVNGVMFPKVQFRARRNPIRPIRNATKLVEINQQLWNIAKEYV